MNSAFNSDRVRARVLPETTTLPLRGRAVEHIQLIYIQAAPRKLIDINLIKSYSEERYLDKADRPASHRAYKHIQARITVTQGLS